MDNTGKFICFSPAKEETDCNGKSLGMGEDVALCYSPRIGRTRIYRSSYANPGKGLKILSFKSEKMAKIRCDQINEAYNNDFKPLLVEVRRICA